MVCTSPPLPSQKKPRVVPTLGRTADVRGGPRVDGALGVLGQGVLPRPVKVVHLVLHEAADLLVLKAAGVVCGVGREGAAQLLLFKHPSQTTWVLTEVLCHH